MLQFDRPVGAPADCQELEYIAALLQTDTRLRLDATVTAIDIASLLTSRHGLRVPAPAITRIRDTVLVELAGSHIISQPQNNDDDSYDDENNINSVVEEEVGDEEEAKGDEDDDHGERKTGDQHQQNVNEPFKTTMDLVQLTALLFIPELLRIRQDSSLYGKDERPSATKDNNSLINNHFDDDDDELSLSSYGSALQSQSPSSTSSTTTSGDHDVDSCSSLSLIQVVFNVLLENAGIEPDSVLTVDVLQTILTAYGEEWPVELLQDMIDCCCCCCSDYNPKVSSSTTKSKHQLPILTVDTFLQALTFDTVRHYPLDRETLESTHYQDAKGVGSVDDKNCNDGIPLKRIYTAPSIDNTADTYRSFWWSILAWITLAATFASYFLDGLGLHQTLPRVDCYDETTGTSSSFGCEVINGVVDWLEIFVELSFFGSSFIFLSTLGNSVYALSTDKLKSKWMSVAANCIGIVTVTFTTILSFCYSVETPLFSTEKKEGSTEYYWSVVFGCIMLVVIVVQLIKLAFPLEQDPRTRNFFVSGALRMECWTKSSARYKVQRMICNALDCHIIDEDDDEDDDDVEGQDFDLDDEFNKDETVQVNRKGSATTLSSVGSGLLKGKSRRGPMTEALLKFHAQSNRTEWVGGIFWFWKRLLFDRTLLTEEGIWLFPRLVFSNLAQWVVCILIPVFLAIAARWIHKNESNLSNYGIKKGEAYFALIIGSFLALAACLGIALIYIPSGISTVLRFRSGFIPSLRDRQFLIYRTAPDMTTVLFGSAFWGMLFTGIVCWLLAGVIAFLLVWEAIRDAMILFVANIIGFMVTIALRYIVLCFLRARWYGAFYRRNPAGANFSSLILECWNLGLSTGYIVVRITRILLVTAFYIGRIDTPLLAPGVGWLIGRIPADSYPISYRKDLLVHEAHRHPYIERLSLLSMLKLRHGSNFGRQSGAAWRILFVLALMPWMRKYRHRPKRKQDQLSSSTHHSATAVSDLWTQKHALELQVEKLQQENEDLKKIADRERKRSVSKNMSGRRRQSWFQEQSKRFSKQPSIRLRQSWFREQSK